jgi:hypothetical protein
MGIAGRSECHARTAGVARPLLAGSRGGEPAGPRRSRHRHHRRVDHRRGILLAVLKANPANTIVSDVQGWARSLAGPFDGMFSFHNARVAIAVNWGIAAVVYVLVGGLIARLLRRPRR